MERFVRFIATAALGLLFVAVAAADTLELKDGRVLQGRRQAGVLDVPGQSAVLQGRWQAGVLEVCGQC